MKRSRVKCLVVTFVLALATIAWAFYATTGTGSGTGGSTGTLTAPVISVPTASTGTHAVTWTQQASLSDSSKDNQIKYTVQRSLDGGSFANVPSGPCSGELAHGTTSCSDTVTTAGSYTYRVIAKYSGWTATSNEAGAVVVTLNTGPAAPTSVALANGGGVGNAYINGANKASLNVTVGLGATSLATDTVHVTITDGTTTTADKTAPATTGSGTVTVTGIDASALSDGTVTISATSSNATGSSSPTTTPVTKDTVKAVSSASSPQYANSSPISVTYTATDTGGSGVHEVELYVDTPTAGTNYVLADTDTTPASASFSYAPSEGEGTYQFYTRAKDQAANQEDAPGTADSSTVYDTTPPVSSATSPQYANSAPITVDYTATDTAGSGVKEVELWARKAGGTFTLITTDTSPATPEFSFTPADGEGTYEFYTRARDNATNYEAAPGSADDSTIYDTTAPESSASSPDQANGATISVTYTATDTAGSGVKEVELWARKAGGTFTLITTDTSPATPQFSFTPTDGQGTYEFYTRARDNATNYEAAPTNADDSTIYDTTAPQLQTLEMFDADTDGRVDQVKATFNEALASSTATTPPWTLANPPGGGSNTLNSVSTSGTVATLTLNEGNVNTARGSFTVALAASASGIRDAAGNQSSFSAQAPVDKAAPVVISINRSGTTPTNAASVGFTVTFSENVSDVDATDFALAATGGVSGASITSVSGSNATRSITVNTGTGSGTLGLNLVDDDTIQDTVAVPNKLGGTGAGNGSFTGQTYTIDKTAPQLVSLDMRDNDTDGRVDRIVAVFDENIQSTSETSNWILTNIPGGGSKGSGVWSGSTPNTFTLEISEGSTVTTAVGSFTVQLNTHASGIRDALGNQSSFAARAPTDDASPVPTALANTDGTTNGLWQASDTATLTFSEDVTNTAADSDVVITGGNGGGNDQWQSPGFLNGTANTSLGRSDYISGNGSVANFADAGLDQPNPNQVRLTLSACSSGACASLTNAGGSGNVVVVPSTTITDAAGNTAAQKSDQTSFSIELF